VDALAISPATLASLVIALSFAAGLNVYATVCPSPEPVSNIALSGAEDVIAIGLTWLATHHPLATGITVGALSLALIGTLRYTYRRIRTVFRRQYRVGEPE
jgi:hypothetical protein